VEDSVTAVEEHHSEYVVVGSGLAAVSAAEEMLRRGIPPSDILIVGEEAEGLTVEEAQLEGWGKMLSKGVRLLDNRG